MNMRYCLIFMLFITNCTNSKQHDSKTFSNKIKGSTSDIELIKGVSVVIDNNSGKIFSKRIEASLRENEPYLKQLLSESILNETVTDIKCCYSDEYLKKGDVSFLLYLELFKVRIYETFKVQFDFKEENCAYADGLIEFLNDNRSEIAKKINNHE